MTMSEMALTTITTTTRTNSGFLALLIQGERRAMQIELLPAIGIAEGWPA